MIRTLLLAAVISVFAVGCASMTPQKFDSATLKFDPMMFFEGPVHSWGVIENRKGSPQSRFRTEVEGRRTGDTLTLTQHFFYEDGRTQQRVWQVRRAGDHRFEATANDVSGPGPGLGEAYGNTFFWEYTLELRPGNPLMNVQMHHWMYLQADGTVMNRVRVTKFGITLSQISEHFQRGTGEVPSIGR
ncbi:MAG TPA: DUF3833 family protein [Thermoanaerobaculia bacterium]|jgi:hypothetical protein|nr:DUF3833 family protein [Thermoanaerobaculia bacterium]